MSHAIHPTRNAYTRKHYPGQDVAEVAKQYAFYLITLCERQLSPREQLDAETEPFCEDCQEILSKKS